MIQRMEFGRVAVFDYLNVFDCSDHDFFPRIRMEKEKKGCLWISPQPDQLQKVHQWCMIFLKFLDTHEESRLGI